MAAKKRKISFKPYTGPAGGWGSAQSLGEILLREQVSAQGAAVLLKQNKPDGFQCVSCAWAKPKKPLPLEFCENGAKATAWEITGRVTPPSFFAAHRVSELEAWSDYDLEQEGRLTHPMRWDEESDTYKPVQWRDAFAEIGAALKALNPAKELVLYSSGRTSLEASYMYGLFGRLMGCNNFPDSSNMCHESTSVALPQTIGVPVGTVFLDDFKKSDCIFFFGQNVGSNAPRMLHPLKEASDRGVPIITFNPLRERGLERFTDPQNPLEMATDTSVRISSSYHQVKAGGDTAAIMGMIKAMVAREDAGEPVMDRAFLAEHTHGYEALAAAARDCAWEMIETRSGLTRGALEGAAAIYCRSSAAMFIYGMGITQHRTGVDNVKMIVNLMLLRGNIGREGAGICPVRGHSNVQGQRTVGITEKPELVPNDKLRELYAFEPPMEAGMNTVEACEAIIKGEIKAFIGLGGNFVRAVPETQMMEAAWRKIPLTVQIATKLNRNHVIHGRVSYVLPVLGRIEIDRQATGPQALSMEDTMTCIHGSAGRKEPISPALLSEPAVVAELAKAALPPNPHIDWDAWVGDYSLIRRAISATYPEIFKDYETRMWQAGGFARPLGARDRIWKTETGKANFSVPKSLEENPDAPAVGRDVLQLITLRSNDQFNTTVYGYHDRFRGISGTRDVLLMNRNDIARLGLGAGGLATVSTAVSDGVVREASQLHIVPYDIPEGCVGGYYPELNKLIPLWHYAEGSKVPAAKSIPVRIRMSGSRDDRQALPQAAE